VNAFCFYYLAAPTRATPTKHVRGSQEWTKRVVELTERNCMNDFEELCELMGVPVMEMTDPEFDELSMEAILCRIRKLHKEEHQHGAETQAARPCVRVGLPIKSTRTDPGSS